jgi:hypothetical protein
MGMWNPFSGLAGLPWREFWPALSRRLVEVILCLAVLLTIATGVDKLLTR